LLGVVLAGTREWRYSEVVHDTGIFVLTNESDRCAESFAILERFALHLAGRFSVMSTDCAQRILTLRADSYKKDGAFTQYSISFRCDDGQVSGMFDHLGIGAASALSEGRAMLTEICVSPDTILVDYESSPLTSDGYREFQIPGASPSSDFLPARSFIEAMSWAQRVGFMFRGKSEFELVWSWLRSCLVSRKVPRNVAISASFGMIGLCTGASWLSLLVQLAGDRYCACLKRFCPCDPVALVHHANAFVGLQAWRQQGLGRRAYTRLNAVNVLMFVVPRMLGRGVVRDLVSIVATAFAVYVTTAPLGDKLRLMMRILCVDRITDGVLWLVIAGIAVSTFAVLGIVALIVDARRAMAQKWGPRWHRVLIGKGLRRLRLTRSSATEIVLDSGTRVPRRPARAEDIRCCACVADIGEGEPVVELPCGHLFHDGCVIPRLHDRAQCPACRVWV
jgi:hypothetical protein